MGQCFRLHADSRHGQGEGRAGTCRRGNHRARTGTSQSGAAGAKHERSEYQAQARPRVAVRKIGRTIDRASAQIAAQDHLLDRCERLGWRPPHLDSDAGTAQSDPMIATISRPAPADHPVRSGLLNRPYPAVMGVLNVTPDSFSDGGRFLAPERALAQARRMIAEGADIIDVGAESTRPYGAQPISAELVSLGVPVSIDSMKSVVIAWALDAGALIANDVWGLQRDPGMAGLLAARHSPVIVMHNRDRADAGIDIMQDIAGFFARSLEIADRAGISRENIVLD